MRVPLVPARGSAACDVRCSVGELRRVLTVKDTGFVLCRVCCVGGCGNSKSRSRDEDRGSKRGRDARDPDDINNKVFTLPPQDS